MHSPSILFETLAPWLLKTIDPFDSVVGCLSPSMSLKAGFKLIALDGNKMRTTSTFYDELTRGIQLPGYFGRNLNALSECLADLEWLHGTGYILFIQNAENVLQLEPPEKLEGFLDVLKSVANEWCQPAPGSRPWNPNPTPFHAIFSCKSPTWRNEIELLNFA